MNALTLKHSFLEVSMSIDSLEFEESSTQNVIKKILRLKDILKVISQ